MITKIRRTRLTDDDERIAVILGGEAKAANKYDGKAEFLNTEAAKRKKIQVYGARQGDADPAVLRRLRLRDDPRPRDPDPGR